MKTIYDFAIDLAKGEISEAMFRNFLYNMDDRATKEVSDVLCKHMYSQQLIANDQPKQ